MQYYELVGLIPGNFSENEIEPVIKEVSEEIKKTGATLKRQDVLGRRKTAYAIKNMRHAYYFLIGLEIETVVLANLEKKLKLNKNILRFLIVKTKEKTAEEIVKEKKRLSRPAEPIAKPRRERTEFAKKPEIKPEPKQAKPEIKPEEPVNLEQLEKKIDEILDEEIK